MAAIRQMLDPQAREKVYAVKDALKRDHVLEQDPMRLNRTQFVNYQAAKAEVLIMEKLAAGLHPNEVYRRVKLAIELTDRLWRKEAKRLATT